MGLYEVKTKSFVVDFSYEYIKNNNDAINIIPELLKYDIYSIDTETTGLDPYTSDLLLLQIGVPGDKAFLFDMRFVHPEILRVVLERDDALYILHNAKFDYKFIKHKCGVSLPNMYDSMLAERMSYLGLYRESTLKALLSAYFGIEADKEVRNEFLYFNIHGDEFSEKQLKYAAHDVVCLFYVMEAQRKRIIDYNLTEACKLEFDLIKHVGNMELTGALIDQELWREVIDETIIKCDRTLEAILPLLSGAARQTGLFGLPAININSQQQLLDALRRLGLEIEDTSSGTLRLVKHEHDVIPLLLDYRGYNKLINSFGDNILSLINPKTGRIHADFNQLVRTGRMSCTNPNLQQIPGDSRFRHCFIAKEGYKLLTCFSEDTPIYTSRGLIFIGDIEVGDLVVTHKGRFKPVINKVRYNVTGYYEVILEGCHYVYKVSKDHRFLVNYLGNWQCITDCAVGDKIGINADVLTKNVGTSSYYVAGFDYVEDRYITIKDNYVWFNIHSINFITENINVVDIEVDEDHSYCCGFTTSHNCDMSQAELRILASYAKEEVFKQAIREGRDLHAANASFVFDVPYEEVLRDKKLPDDDPSKHNYRSKVKAIIFGLCYGMSKYGLSKRLNISEVEAESLINLFFKKFPNAKRFLDNAAKMPLLKGYSETISGRKRFYRKLSEYYDPKERKAAEQSMRRRGMNTPIQGCIAAGMHVAGAGVIENNVGSVLKLPVGSKNTLLSKGKYSGVKDVYKLTTQLGFELVATNDHRVTRSNSTWARLGEMEGKSVLMTAFVYSGKPISVAKVCSQMGIRKSKYMSEGYAFMFGYGLTNLLSNYNCYKLVNINNNIEHVFKKYYISAFGRRAYLKITNSGDTTILCIGKNEASFINFMVKNKYKFIDVVLKSPKEVRGAFIAGFIANNMYSVAYDLQYGMYIPCSDVAESRTLQQILLSIGIIASSGRDDISEGTVGCVISSEFIGNIVQYIPFVNMECDKPTYVDNFKDKVVSIEYVGKRKTYDFIGKRKPHSYICQGIYVHNSNADVIKKATCILGDRLQNYDANIILQVHDEIVVEAREDQAEEVANIVSGSIVDGWDFYFKDVPMEADVNIKPHWEK